MMHDKKNLPNSKEQNVSCQFNYLKGLIRISVVTMTLGKIPNFVFGRNKDYKFICKVLVKSALDAALYFIVLR